MLIFFKIRKHREFDKESDYEKIGAPFDPLDLIKISNELISMRKCVIKSQLFHNRIGFNLNIMIRY